MGNCIKSAATGGGMFRDMFEHFPKFKLYYRGGIYPDLTVVTANGGFPKIMTIDYGDSLQGVMEYKNSTGKFATVDYGNCTCDNLSARKTQDSTTVITLGQKGK